MNVVKVLLGVLAAALAWDAAHAQEKLMDFTGRERPGMVLIDDFSGLLRHRPDLRYWEDYVRIVNTIGEGFLDVETALPTPDLAARRPKVTPEILAAMDGWTNEYGLPWTVASYGGPLTPERKLAHTIQFNTGFILYSSSSEYSNIENLEKYMLKDIDTAKKYKEKRCPLHKLYVAETLNPGGMHYFFGHESFDANLCHSILYGWLRRNVSELASLDRLSAIGELFAWYHSPDYAPGDLPKEVESMIEGWEIDSGRRWRNSKYEGKRYEDIKRDLTANLERVNAGRLPDAPEAGVADYGTMLFLIATGRLLPPSATYVADQP